MLTYILHFDAPVAGKRHYVGSCEEAELPKRLRRHQLGTASSLTRRAHLQGTGFTVAALMQSPDRSLEKRVKTNRHYDRKCNVCQQNADVPSLFTNVLYFPPVDPKDGDCVVNWETGLLA